MVLNPKEFIEPISRINQMLDQLASGAGQTGKKDVEGRLKKLIRAGVQDAEEGAPPSPPPAASPPSPPLPPPPPRRPPSSGGPPPDDPDDPKKGRWRSFIERTAERLGFGGGRERKRAELSQQLEGMGGRKEAPSGGQQPGKVRNFFNYIGEMAGIPSVDKMREASQQRMEDLKTKIAMYERERQHAEEQAEFRQKKADVVSQKLESVRKQHAPIEKKLADLEREEEQTKKQLKLTAQQRRRASKGVEAALELGETGKAVDLTKLAAQFDVMHKDLKVERTEQKGRRKDLEEKKEKLPSLDRLEGEHETAQNRLFRSQERSATLTEKLIQTNRELMEQGKKDAQIGRHSAKETGEHLFRVARGLGVVADGLKGTPSTASAAKMAVGFAHAVSGVLGLLPGAGPWAKAGAMIAAAPLQLVAKLDEFSDENLRQNFALAKVSPHMAMIEAKFQMGTMIRDMQMGAALSESAGRAAEAKLDRMKASQETETVARETKNKLAGGWDSFMADVFRFNNDELRNTGETGKMVHSASNFFGAPSPKAFGSALVANLPTWLTGSIGILAQQKADKLKGEEEAKFGEKGEDLYAGLRPGGTSTIGEEFIMAGKGQSAPGMISRGGENVPFTDWQADLSKPARFGRKRNI